MINERRRCGAYDTQRDLLGHDNVKKHIQVYPRKASASELGDYSD